MAPRGHPDDEIIGYEGGIGLGGSVSLRPVRVRDRHREGGGCCLGAVVLVALGIVAAWVLGRVVARRGHGGPSVRAAQTSWQDGRHARASRTANAPRATGVRRRCEGVPGRTGPPVWSPSAGGVA